MARLTSKGRKARATRRRNQVKKRISSMKIGDKDASNLYDLLTKNLTTKVGVERSKRLEDLLLDQGDSKKLSRFKEFSQLKNVDASELTKNDLVRSIGRDDYDFYLDNKELILEYNTRYKEYVKQYGKGFNNKQSSNYNYEATRNLRRESEGQRMATAVNKYRNKKLVGNNPFG